MVAAEDGQVGAVERLLRAGAISSLTRYDAIPGAPCDTALELAERVPRTYNLQPAEAEDIRKVIAMLKRHPDSRDAKQPPCPWHCSLLDAADGDRTAGAGTRSEAGCCMLSQLFAVFRTF